VVTHSRAPLGACHVRPLVSTKPSVTRRADLRPLNAPSPLQVQLHPVERSGTWADDHGRIVSVWRQGRLTPRTIAAVQDHWRIDDEWWREHPVSRAYFELLLDDGTLLTIYHDLLSDLWFEQRR
jgi:hypothetical protein